MLKKPRAFRRPHVVREKVVLRLLGSHETERGQISRSEVRTAETARRPPHRLCLRVRILPVLKDKRDRASRYVGDVVAHVVVRSLAGGVTPVQHAV